MKTKKLVISYFPCFYPDQSLVGVDIDWDEDKFREHFDSLGEDIVVHGVLWANYPFEEPDNQKKIIIPIIMVDKKEEVVDHLRYWSDGDFNKWFTLCLGSKSPNDYAIALMPNIELSIERQESVRKPSKGDFEYIVLFQALATVCHGSTFEFVKNRLRDSIPVGFVDISNIDRDDPMSLDPDSITVLGPFKVDIGFSGFYGSYLSNLYEEFEKDPGVPPKFKGWNIHNN